MTPSTIFSASSINKLNKAIIYKILNILSPTSIKKWQKGNAVKDPSLLTINLSMPKYPNITFDISISNGQFILWEPGDGVTAPVTKNIPYLGSSFSAGNDTTLYWNNMIQTGERVVEPYMGSEAYADIVMRDGKNIVGYAVIKIYTVVLDNAPAQNYQAILLKSVSFPKVNGHYQNVTDKYVASEIESVKAE